MQGMLWSLHGTCWLLGMPWSLHATRRRVAWPPRAWSCNDYGWRREQAQAPCWTTVCKGASKHKHHAVLGALQSDDAGWYRRSPSRAGLVYRRLRSPLACQATCVPTKGLDKCSRSRGLPGSIGRADCCAEIVLDVPEYWTCLPRSSLPRRDVPIAVPILIAQDPGVCLQRRTCSSGSPVKAKSICGAWLWAACKDEHGYVLHAVSSLFPRLFSCFLLVSSCVLLVATRVLKARASLVTLVSQLFPARRMGRHAPGPLVTSLVPAEVGGGDAGHGRASSDSGRAAPR
jgi:hypothetical protein